MVGNKDIKKSQDTLTELKENMENLLNSMNDIGEDGVKVKEKVLDISKELDQFVLAYMSQSK